MTGTSCSDAATSSSSASDAGAAADDDDDAAMVKVQVVVLWWFLMGWGLGCEDPITISRYEILGILDLRGQYHKAPVYY
jgi:hypothetical protein